MGIRICSEDSRMKFQISQEYKQLQQRSRRLAQDFVTRVAEHDREASHPLENYAALRREGFNVMYRKRRTAGELDCLATSRRLRNWPKAALLPLFRSTCICRYAFVDCRTAVRESRRSPGNPAVHFPPSDFCLSSLGILELGLDPREVIPPLK